MSVTPEDPDYYKHGGFPQYEAADPPPGFVRFVSAMRRLQDLAVSAAPDDDVCVMRRAASRISSTYWTPSRRRKEFPRRDAQRRCRDSAVC